MVGPERVRGALEHDGAVVDDVDAVREPEPGDRRVVQLHATEAGRVALHAADAAYLGKFGSLLDSVGEPDDFVANLLAIGAFTSLTWHYALAEHLVRREDSEVDVRAISAKLDPSLASYAVAIGIGLV